MIHGIYLKSRPKSKWHLVSVTASPESAAHDVEEAIKQAKAEGNDEAVAATQVFESSFYIPHYLDELKEQKPMYN